jgi:hypothetical protein
MKCQALFVVALLPVLALAQPQQSENFRIAKSVLDGGGGPSSSASFQLVSAYAQPSPLGIQTSTNFILSGGFLSPTFEVSPVSPVQALVIQPIGVDVHLCWRPIGGADYYKIYRSTNVTTLPSPGDSIGFSTDTTFTDIGACLLPAVRYYYAVTTVGGPLMGPAVAKAPSVPVIKEEPQRPGVLTTKPPTGHNRPAEKAAPTRKK